MELSRRDVPDIARSAGGVLLAVGALTLLAHKSGHHHWSHFELLLVVLIPAVVLYAMALAGSTRGTDEPAQPWQRVLLVLAILLGPIALLQFLVWIGANTGRHVLYGAGVFALTSVIAAYAARRARVSYAALLAALALLVTWLLVWEKILDHPSIGTYRWLLVAGAAVLFAVAGALGRAGAIGAGETATAGGVAAVAAGLIGVIVGLVSAAFASVISVFESSSVSTTASRHHPLAGLGSGLHSGLQHFGWDLYLLLVSAALLWIGARARRRGLGYVGGVGLLAFVLSVGAQITRIESGHAATGAIVGWPLVLLILGVAGLVAPALRRERSPNP